VELFLRRDTGTGVIDFNLISKLSLKQMTMKKLLLFCLLWLLVGQIQAQKVKNSFFALHNIIRGDSIYDTFEEQVALVKNAGFDAIEINQVESFEGMKKALDQHQFQGAYFYVKVKLEPPYLDARLPQYIAQLKGSKTIIAPYIVSESKRFKSSSHEKTADSLSVVLLQQVAELAKAANLKVALYPHIYFYVERCDHALDLVKAVKRKNVGLSFNLCHWLATTSASERPQLKVLLQSLRPSLNMVTICGANDVVSTQKNIWDDYILPLGEGSFDTYALVRHLIRDLKYQGPIGVQCYNIKGNKLALVNRTIHAWQAYRSQLERN
jgi:sugar phosphate isomerase/epimerase